MNRKGLYIMLLLTAGVATVIFAASRPIPTSGPLAKPKSLQQVGIPLQETSAAVPTDNPQTPQKIALGEKLFFDARLSVDGTVACRTCHDPASGFTVGMTASVGIIECLGKRSAQTIFNALDN